MKFLKGSIFTLCLCSTIPAYANHEKMEEMLEKCDTNKDGLISEAEFVESKKEHFKKIDKDNNGSLDQNERKMMMEKKHHKREHSSKDNEDK